MQRNFRTTAMTPRLAALPLAALALLALRAGGQDKNPLGGLLPKGGPDLRRQADEFLKRELGKALGVEAPLVLDPNSAFRQASGDEAPTQGDFKPTPLRTLADLDRPLAPGDYSFVAMFYCTQWSVHRPGRGHPYALGRARGRLAKPISALLYRGTIRGVSPGTLNAMAWRAQASVPLDKWSEGERAQVHELIPEYEREMQGDWLQRIERDYNRTFRLFTRKSFDDALKGLGELGRQTLALKAAHQTLADPSVVSERLPDLMYERFGAGGTPQLPDDPDHPSPWMRVSPGVLARFTVEGGIN